MVRRCGGEEPNYHEAIKLPSDDDGPAPFNETLPKQTRCELEDDMSRIACWMWEQT